MIFKKLRKPALWLCLSAMVVTAGCKKDETPIVSDDERRAVVVQYAAIVSANYADAISGVENLKTKIDAFLASPSADGLEAAKQAWLDARVPYLQSEAFRLYDGPIDSPEGLINAWPMDEAFVDYVVGSPNAGIINDTVNYPTITRDIIINANENGGETNISTGFHAIEFLLWGQDLSATGPGARPFTDYSTAKNAQRRGLYLKLLVDLLLESLNSVAVEWDPASSTNYRATFISQTPNTSLKLLMDGIGKLTFGELRGERIDVAIGTKLQEDEHSCFSDNTTNDIIYDAKGIQNVYLGSYTRTDGTVVSGASLSSLVKKLNADLDTRVVNALNATNSAALAVPYPFDQAIIHNTAAVQAVSDDLEAQAHLLKEAGTALGFEISISLD